MSSRNHDNFLNETFFERNLVPFSRSREDSLLKCLVEVDVALTEKGYDSLSQIVGYLVSGDPVYITSYKSARKSILSFSREEILKFLLKECLEKYRD